MGVKALGQIQVSTGEEETRVMPATSIDGSNAHLLLAALQPLLKTNPQVVIDLRHCELMTSKGLAVLLETHRLAGSETCLRIQHANLSIRQLMSLCGIDRLIDIERSNP